VRRPRVADRAMNVQVCGPWEDRKGPTQSYRTENYPLSGFAER